jgi:glycosyltransferase involved in cell wall biosynthesis
VKIYLDNVDLNSSSGPNSFGRKLRDSLVISGHYVSTSPMGGSDVQLSFIQTSKRSAPVVALRLDGIYFNTRQDWAALNAALKRSHEDADLVIYQSEFNRRLTEKYFGKAKKSAVINNGTSLSEISSIPKIDHPALNKFDEIWCCASSWRPHKRLRDNIEYFLQNRPKNTGLVVLGENPDHIVKHPDVLYVGKQDWKTCISVYKRSKKFIHLAFLDHCPNVVVDARASDCEIVVSSSGGTKEIAGTEATVVQDLEWDMRPLDLYDPPDLDLTKFYRNGLESTIDIREVASKYVDCLLETM